MAALLYQETYGTVGAGRDWAAQIVVVSTLKALSS